MSTNIGINGFGRIGRQILRIIAEEDLDIKIVAINGRSEIETYKHLLKYDSAYGKIKIDIKILGQEILKQMIIHSEKFL